MMKGKVKWIIAGGFLLGTFIMLVTANILWGRHMIDSDYATQLLLSKICSEEKRILTDSWVYGNEIRFINTQIIYGLVFLFTADWSVVRTIGNAILYLLMLGAYFYMMKQVKIDAIYKLAGGGGVLIPYSIVALSIIYMSADYLPPVCIMFIVLGAFLRIVESVDQKNRKYVTRDTIILGAVSLLAGMNGFRSVLVIAAPLCLTGLYRSVFRMKSTIKNELYVWIVFMVSFTAGIAVNMCWLMDRYGFSSHGTLSFAEIGSGILLENIERCLGAFLGSMGYAAAPVFTLHGIIDMAVLCFAVYAVYMVIRNLRYEKESFSEEFLKQFLICSILFNFLFYGITDNRMLIPRYVIHINSLLIPVLLICLYQEKNKTKKYILMIVMIGFFGIGAARTYYSLAMNDYNENRYASINFLKENHLEFGYATPWNAGVITELTDGEIEVVNMGDIVEGVPKLETCPKRWFTEPYEKPCFLLLSRKEYSEYSGSGKLSNGELAYEDENFIIFVYQDAEDICSFRM